LIPFGPLRILLTFGACAAASILSCPRLEAQATFSGKAYDGEASGRAILAAFRQGQSYNPAVKVPLASTPLTIQLLGSSVGSDGLPRAQKTWNVTTSDDGSFTLDAGLGAWPETSLLVATCELGGTRRYSPFLKPSAQPVDVHLYPTSDNPASILANVKVAYDIDNTGGTKSLRVRVGVHLINQGAEMYIGRRTSGRWREVWRLPLPQGAKVIANTGPVPGLPAWKPSEDGRSMVLDAPLPGFCDFELQRSAWELQYLIPARQTLVQAYALPVPVDEQKFTLWCVHDEMSCESPQLEKKDSRAFPDPFSGEDRNLDVAFSSEPLRAGTDLQVILRVDNVAIGQAVSVNALKWVGGFVLVCILGILLGLALGPRGPSSDVLLEGLSGEEVLDRIAQLDARFAAGKIKERDYRKLREPLIELAAEELSQPSAAGPAGDGALALNAAARDILRRLDDMDRAGVPDASQIAQRALLLEALAKSLPREHPRKE